MILHQGVGGRLDLESYTLAAIFKGASGVGALPQPDGPKVRMRIVGIVRRPLDLGDFASSGGVLIVTPAFDRTYAKRIGNYGALVRVRTQHGATDVKRIVSAASGIFRKSGAVSAVGVSSETEGAPDAIHVLAVALQILAGVVALAGIVTIAIVMAREISLSSVDHGTLRALGLTRAGRVLINAPRIALVAIGGALLAGISAVLASPLMPVGVARRADPDPGMHFDWLVLASGVLFIVAAVIAVGLIAAIRSERRSAFEDATSPRSSTLTRLRARLSPTAANGLRMALVPGRGRTAVPVRSSCFGAVFGVVGVVTVAVFGASLGHLAATPRLYGRSWDFNVNQANFSPTNGKCDANDFKVAAIPGVEAVAAVCDNDLQLDQRPVTAWGVTPVRGTIEPQIVMGRLPGSRNEVALGAITLHALKKSIGDTVHGGPKGTVTYRIVGQVVLSSLGYPQPLADGAAFTGAGLARIFDRNSRASRNLLVRFEPGANQASVERRIRKIGELGSVGGATVPAEVDRLRNVNWVPVTLAALLGGLALLAVAHALVIGVRRRRRDLALLKTLGFRRRQVRATVAWQATILAIVGLVFGIPLGIVTGRIAWRVVADGLGISATVTVPAFALSGGALCALVLVNLVAVFPARSAAGVITADALRSE